MITYGSTTLTSYNTITNIEVYYYKSTSATSLSGGSWSTTKPTWENGKYIWQKIRTTYEGKLENGQYYSESDPVNITGQQGATGTAAYSYKLNASNTIITKSEKGEYSVSKITFTSISKQGTNNVNAYAGRFKIETTANGTTWTTRYPTSGTGVDESSKEYTIPTDIIAIRCSLYQSGGFSTLLDIMTIPIINDGVGMIDPPYKEVEWVESTGKQYVYLDWKPPIKTWGFEVDFISRNAVSTTMGAWNESTNKNGYGTIFGVRNSSGVNNAQLSSYNNGLLRIGNSTAITTAFKTDHSRQTIKLHGTTITRANGVTATVTRVDETTGKPYCNMAVFGLYEGLRRTSTGNIVEPSSTRIYSLKFYDGDTLAVDLVGSIRKADGITGLYDKVSKHFYPAPGMLFGNEVGDITNVDTVADSLNKTDVSTTVVNKNRTRMWETSVPFNRLEDGQKITITYSYGNVVNSTQTSELVGWDDTSSNSNVYLRLTYPDGTKSEWIPCYYSQTARLTTHYGAGTAIIFTYRENLLSNATETTGGSAIVRGFFANASYYQNTSYTQYSNNVKAGTNGIKGYTLIMKDSENTWSCFYSGAYKTTNTGKPVYTGGFMLGKILYSAGAGAQTSNSSLDTYYNYKSGVNTSTIYDAYPVDLRYSTNCASTLISQRPVYIVGTIENDGLFHLDVSQWYTQTEPTYADGKVYVYVGMAYSSYQIWLSTENPAYIYYNGEFILYDKAQTLQNIASLKDSLETQIDSKVETWCQKTNPATSWTAEERPNHTGDLWYYIGESGNTYKNNTTYQYNGSTNTWSAYSANPDLFDKIDGKTAIYYGTQSSATSAEEGDYLVDETDGSSYRWNNGAWVKVTDYKTAINNIQIGGRNLLCNSNQSLTTVSSKGDFYLSETIPTGTTVIASVQIDADNIVWETTDRCRIGFEMSQSSDGIATGTQYVGVWWGKTGTTNNGADINYNTSSTGATSYHGRIWSKVTLTRPFLADIKRGGIYVQGIASGTYKISNPKVEIATKPSDWSPAPEDTQADIDTALSQSIWYATCSDAGATKSATIIPVTTNFVLNIGTTVNVKFDNTNTGAVGSLTLNINNTGAKNIKYIYNKTLNNLPSSEYIVGGMTYLFVYDGTYWVIQNMNYNTNETNHILNNFSGKTGELGIWQTGLFMKDGNGTYQNICTDSSGNITRTNANTKKANPNGFEVGSSVYLSTGSTTYAANSNISGAVYASYGAFDSRYSLNTTLTANCLTPYQPVYLVGTINNGLYYLDTIWWTQTPNDSTKVYVLIGGCYDSTTSYCRINLYEQNNWYKYVDGQLVDYTNRLAELAATTATSFIEVETNNHGIYVHPEDDMSTGWKIGDAIELFKSGLSYIKLWIENNIPKIRIGKSDQGHVLLDNDSVDIKNNNDVIASFGETTIIGKEAANNLRTKIAGGSFQIIDDDNSAIVNIGKVRATASQAQKIHFSFGTRYNTAYGNYSFVQGTSNAAVFDNQVALGRYGKYGALLTFMPTISSANPTFTQDISTYLSRGFTKEDIEITVPNYSGNYTWDLNNGIITVTFLKEEQTQWMMVATIKIYIGEYVALMIGNGSENNRSNAVEMLWDGNIKMALDTDADEGTTDKKLYTAITSLDWENDVITT